MQFSIILYAKSELITVSYIVNTPSSYLFHCLRILGVHSVNGF
jgi:hypothetical protein